METVPFTTATFSFPFMMPASTCATMPLASARPSTCALYARRLSMYAISPGPAVKLACASRPVRGWKVKDASPPSEPVMFAPCNPDAKTESGNPLSVSVPAASPPRCQDPCSARLALPETSTNESRDARPGAIYKGAGRRDRHVPVAGSCSRTSSTAPDHDESAHAPFLSLIHIYEPTRLLS